MSWGWFPELCSTELSTWNFAPRKFAPRNFAPRGTLLHAELCSTEVSTWKFAPRGSLLHAELCYTEVCSTEFSSTRNFAPRGTFLHGIFDMELCSTRNFAPRGTLLHGSFHMEVCSTRNFAPRGTLLHGIFDMELCYTEISTWKFVLRGTLPHGILLSLLYAFDRTLVRLKHCMIKSDDLFFELKKMVKHSFPIITEILIADFGYFHHISMNRLWIFQLVTFFQVSSFIALSNSMVREIAPLLRSGVTSPPPAIYNLVIANLYQFCAVLCVGRISLSLTIVYETYAGIFFRNQPSCFVFSD